MKNKPQVFAGVFALAFSIGYAVSAALAPTVTLLIDDQPDMGFTCLTTSTVYDTDAHLTVHAVDCSADRIFQNSFE